MGLFLTSGTHYHSVTKITASSYDGKALKLTLHGDSSASDEQHNQAEIVLFTEDPGMVGQLIEAINKILPTPAPDHLPE
jgi:hypothetical protein